MIAAEAGATTIEINPETTESASSFTAAWRGKAGTILPKLIESLAR